MNRFDGRHVHAGSVEGFLVLDAVERSPLWPADASVEGRLLARQVGRGKHKQWLYCNRWLIIIQITSRAE